MKLTTLQNGRYQIESILGQGGFGITYRAVQTSLGRTVAIKEFFMKDYCERAEDSTRITLGTQSNREMVTRYREKFEKEARTLAKLEHPHIVRVIDVFQENNTSYYVMEYAEGASLKQQVDEKGPLSEAKAVSYICQVADALRYLHQQHICHLDIKPANILTKANGDAVLADFGLAKQYDKDGGETSTTPVGKSKGYAPPEQYRTGGVQSFSPETDIYALGATLYFLLTGKTPPESVLLNEESLDVSTLSPNMAQAVQVAMQLRRADRATLDAFEGLLNKKPEQPKPSKDEDITIVDVEPTPVKPQTKGNSSAWSKYNKLIKATIITTIFINSIWLIIELIGGFFLPNINLYSGFSLHFVEIIPLLIFLYSCILLCKGFKSGYWGVLSSLSLCVIYWITFYNTVRIAILTLWFLIPTSIALLFLFIHKRNGITVFSLLQQTKGTKWIMTSIVIIAFMTSFITPFYIIAKYDIKLSCKEEWTESVMAHRRSNLKSSLAYTLYEWYSDGSFEFNKNSEWANYWLQRSNELKAQGK